MAAVLGSGSLNVGDSFFGLWSRSDMLDTYRST